MGKVFVLGSLNMDLVICSARFPEQGETLVGNSFMVTPGGKGGNQAVASALQGTETIMLGSIGDDSFSFQLTDALKQYGVNCNYINRVANMNCGVASIWVTSYDNRIIIYQGANLHHNNEEIINLIKSIGSRDDIIIAQLEIPIEVVTKVFQTAKSIGMKTMLNPAPASQLSDELLSHTDILIPNENELLQIVKYINPTIKSIEDAMKALLEKGIKELIVTFGSKGSIYQSRESKFHMESYPVTPIDTTAAGDTYIGALASRIITGDQIKDAMNYASAAASIAVQTLGAQVSIPRKDTVIQFMKGFSR